MTKKTTLLAKTTIDKIVHSNAELLFWQVLSLNVKNTDTHTIVTNTNKLATSIKWSHSFWAFSDADAFSLAAEDNFSILSQFPFALPVAILLVPVSLPSWAVNGWPLSCKYNRTIKAPSAKCNWLWLVCPNVTITIKKIFLKMTTTSQYHLLRAYPENTSPKRKINLWSVVRTLRWARK